MKMTIRTPAEARRKSVSRIKQTKLIFAEPASLQILVVIKATDPDTMVVMKRALPKTAPNPMLPEVSEETNAATLEKTSGAPFPMASKVTPATAGESFSACEMCSSKKLGDRIGSLAIAQ